MGKPRPGAGYALDSFPVRPGLVGAFFAFAFLGRGADRPSRHARHNNTGRGGVGIGLSTHAGMVVVCDGSRETDERIKRVFVTDPGMGVVRHADAGYQRALEFARLAGIRLPMVKP